MALHQIYILGTNDTEGFVLTSAHVRSGGVFKDAWKTRKAALENARLYAHRNEGVQWVMIVDGVQEEAVVTAVSYSPKMGLTVYAYNGHAHCPALMVAAWIREGLIGRNDVSDLMGMRMADLRDFAAAVVKGQAGEPLEVLIHDAQRTAAHAAYIGRANSFDGFHSLAENDQRASELRYKQARMARDWLVTKYNPCGPHFRPNQTF